MRKIVLGLINNAQSTAGITIQRPAQITLATPIATPPSGTTYHVPRGPAVVANLAAPRSNVATAIRAPMVVTQTTGQVFSFCFLNLNCFLIGLF